MATLLHDELTHRQTTHNKQALCRDFLDVSVNSQPQLVTVLYAEEPGAFQDGIRRKSTIFVAMCAKGFAG